MAWSSASSTCSNSLLKHIMYYLNDSPFSWRMLRRCPVDFLCHCPPMKWQTKALLNCSKFATVPEGILPNHTLVASFSVVGKALHITSSRVIYKSIRVLNVSKWSKGSLELLNVSSWGRQNFDGRGRFNTSVVNGELVLRIILSRFSTALSFIAFLSSSISLLMLWSSFFILDEWFTC